MKQVIKSTVKIEYYFIDTLLQAHKSLEEI